jgi:two-component system, NarL family, response regulator LiaR
MPIRILIVDSYSMVREGLRMFLLHDLDLEIVGEAADGKEAIEKVYLLRPDLILIDLLLPGQDGIMTIAVIHEGFPLTPVLVLSGVLESATVTNALRAGAIGYLTKDIRASELRAALKAAAAGQAQFSPSVSAYVLDEVQPPELRQSDTECQGHCTL